uniref:Double-strand-break repair protein rad21 n=1 Tax=Ditylenchus dipsaci TaxID=166011 RepID=A0A915CRD9_9BILA
MFYAQFVLSKKGPLSKIWLAAHWERKLSKAQIFETNVQDAVDEILKPKVKLSLRTTGHLLLGIVRIYSRKAKYVLADCNEAFLKIKMAFRSGGVEEAELREKEDREGSELPMLTDFEDLDNIPSSIEDYQVGNVNKYPINQTHLGAITLRDDHLETSSNYDSEINEDDFGDRAQQNNLGFEDSFGLDDIETDRFSGQINRPSTSFNGNANMSLLLEDQELDLMFAEGDFGDISAPVSAAPAAVEPMEIDGACQPNIDVIEQDSFSSSLQLEPLDKEAMQQQNREKVVRRQRNAANMANYSDTIQPLDLAPPTKQLMRLKESGATEKLFSMPGCANAILDPQIIRIYQSHLVLCTRDMNERVTEDIRAEMGMVDDIEMGADGYQPQQPEDLNAFGGPGTPIQPDINYDEDISNANRENLEPLELENEKRNGSLDAVTTPASAQKRSTTRKSHQLERDEEEDEEDEQVFTRRTKTILHSIALKLRANDNKILFEDLFTRGSTKRTAAQKFYALLELHKWQAIEVDQSEPFAPIEISAGGRMTELLEAA